MGRSQGWQAPQFLFLGQLIASHVLSQANLLVMSRSRSLIHLL
jgi:hypothetical protein